jgi:hypothetical protein
MKSPLPVLNVGIALCLTALIGFTMTAFSQEPTAPSPSSAESHFKVISISRSKVYPPPPNTELKAKEGYVFIAVTYVPVPLKSVDDFPNDRNAFLVDSQGKESGAVYTALVGKPGKIPDNGVFVFAMSEGATPKEMILNGSPVDLTRTQQPPRKRPTSQPAK